MLPKNFILYFLTRVLVTSAQWFTGFNIEQPENNVQCRFNDWQCDDGSCVSRSRLCDGFDDCPDGSDELQFRCAPRKCPADAFDCGDSCIDLQLYCDGHTDCSNGYDESNEVCRRKCDLTSPSIVNGFVKPDFGKSFFETNNKNEEPYRVKIDCASGYSVGKGNLTCINGTWTGVAPACTECGIIKPGPRRVTPEGDSYQYGVTPWHVGVYSKLKKPYNLICGGSLLSAKVVLSAAQCFWDDAIGLLPAPVFAVAAGKVFGGWDDDQDYDAQTSDVDEIKVPELFLGETSNMMHNIALVTLASSFSFTRNVNPVCLDLSALFINSFSIEDDDVSVWRRTSSKQNLNIADVFNLEPCKTKLPYDLLKYIASDKFCNVYNGSTFGTELAGSGLVYNSGHFGEKKFYIRSIVSVGKDQSNSPLSSKVLISTSIAEYRRFIETYF